MTVEPVDPRPTPADELVRRYEALRRAAVGETGNDALGRALLVHRGMVAWIEAWGTCRATPATQLEGVPCGRAGAGDPQNKADVLPAGVLGQVARVLTGMAVAGLRERRA
jgi:hypothetical protein